MIVPLKYVFFMSGKPNASMLALIDSVLPYLALRFVALRLSRVPSIFAEIEAGFLRRSSSGTKCFKSDKCISALSILNLNFVLAHSILLSLLRVSRTNVESVTN